MAWVLSRAVNVWRRCLISLYLLPVIWSGILCFNELVVFIFVSSLWSCSGDFVDVKIYVGWRQTKLIRLLVCGMILIHCFSTQRLVQFSVVNVFSWTSPLFPWNIFFDPINWFYEWIVFLSIPEGTLLDGNKGYRSSQHWWPYNPCQHWYWCNNSWGTPIWLVSLSKTDIERGKWNSWLPFVCSRGLSVCQTWYFHAQRKMSL